MGQIIADTNIFIYLLKNDLQLGQLLDKKIIYISYNLRIPDAIIAATSFAYFIPLITADKNFRRIKEIDSSIYTIS